MTARRILLVTYFFPPSRDTGVLRPAAMAKYLRRLGHEVTVVTTSAYGELPGDADEGVVRTADAQRWRAKARGADRVGALYDSDTYAGRPHPLSRIIVPEPLVLAWAPFARRAALRLHRERRFDAVSTTAPRAAAPVGGRARPGGGGAGVAAVRHGWTFEPLRPRFPTGAQRRLDERIERRWLGDADRVVCVSEPAAEDLRARGVARPVVVANGWDPDLAPPAAAGDTGLLDPDRVSLVYTGRFGSYGRDPSALVEGLHRRAREDPEAAARLELVIAGPLTDDEAELFAGDVAPARITVAGSLERARALALQREAEALLLVAQPTRSQLLNIKLFEYLASGRPILALAAGTEAGRLVAEIGGTSVRADDPAAIATELAELVRRPPGPPPADAVAPYTYPAPAERLAEVVEEAIAAAA